MSILNFPSFPVCKCFEKEEMYPHRGIGVSHRFLELLETLKVEFETLAHEVNVSKIQRDEYERQSTFFTSFISTWNFLLNNFSVQTLLGELTNMQGILHDLERKHNKIKQQ